MTLDKKKKYGVIGRLALLGATLLWGTSFVVLKNTLDSVPVLYLLAIRFTGAAILLAIAGARELKKIDLGYVKNGAVMGLFLFIAYVFQTYGLKYTTPGKNAFLTAAYCVMVPFFNWLLYKSRPSVSNVLAAFICIFGMGLVSLGGDFSVGLGEGLTAVCGVFYALHIIVTARAVQGRSPLMLTMIQFAAAAVLCWIGALFTERFPTDMSSGAALSIAYLCVMCTAACFLLQTVGQKYTPPAAAAVLLTLESVFGALISVLFYDEKLTLRLICGFAMIFVAVIISETGGLRKNGKAGGKEKDRA